MNTDRGPRQLWAAADVSSSDLGVYTVIGALMGVGLLLIVVAAWLFRATKPEMELLSPLERMSDRSWKRLDPAMQRRDLDVLRPPGARPIERSTQVPSIDEDFDKPIPDIGTFDDLTSMQAADVRRSTADQTESVVASAATADGVEGDDTTETNEPDLADAAMTPPRGLPAIVDDVPEIGSPDNDDAASDTNS